MASRASLQKKLRKAQRKERQLLKKVKILRKKFSKFDDAAVAASTMVDELKYELKNLKE